MVRKPKRNTINKFNNPEASRLIDLWRRARLGRLDARDRLLNTLLSYQNPDLFTKAWIRMTSGPEYENQLTPEDRKAEKKKQDKWQKSVSKSTPAIQTPKRLLGTPRRVVVVSGGLPSLGKSSK